MKTLTPRSFNCYLLISFIFFAVLLLLPPKAYAYETLILDDLKDVPDDLSFDFTYENAEFEFTGVDGIVRRENVAGYDLYWVSVPTPSGKQNGGFSYSDFLNITFPNIGSIGDRLIDINIHIDNLEVTTSGPEKLNNRTYFLAFSTNDIPRMEFKSCVSKQFYVDYTISITYSDSGELVSLPFFQKVYDLDLGTSNDYFNEGWMPLNGFDTLYLYKDTALVNDNGFFNTPDGYSYVYEDELFKSGIVASAPIGQFSGRFEEGNCGSTITIYSQFTNIKDPVKAAIITS